MRIRGLWKAYNSDYNNIDKSIEIAENIMPVLNIMILNRLFDNGKN